MVHQRHLNAFKLSLDRSETLCGLFEHIAGTTTDAIDTSDLLRASLVTSTSAFDYLIHETFRAEVVYRVANDLLVNNFKVPVAMLGRPKTDIFSELDLHIKRSHGHLSFMMPDKITKPLSCLLSHPWQKIASHLGKDESSLRSRLKLVVDWRNRIVHEADVDPDLGGIGFFSIDVGDVREANMLIKALGESIVSIVVDSR